MRVLGNKSKTDYCRICARMHIYHPLTLYNYLLCELKLMLYHKLLLLNTEQYIYIYIYIKRHITIWLLRYAFFMLILPLQCYKVTQGKR